MKERPILFSAPMVRSILEGRKTQTRRVVKGVPVDFRFDGYITESTGDMKNKFSWSPKTNFKYDITGGFRAKCPYGQPGDRLWVRETFGISAHNGVVPFYKATEPNALVYKCKPSIHMPRWASRITLEIASIRVERLQDISEDDARAEGVDWLDESCYARNGWCPSFHDPDSGGDPVFRHGFEELWESINGPGSWDINPWVWVVEFKKIPIDK